MGIQIVVVDEHTLGVLFNGNVFQPLSGPVTKGGMDPNRGWTYVNPDINRIRTATREDFVEYRVSAKGYIEAGLID